MTDLPNQASCGEGKCSLTSGSPGHRYSLDASSGTSECTWADTSPRRHPCRWRHILLNKPASQSELPGLPLLDELRRRADQVLAVRAQRRQVALRELRLLLNDPGSPAARAALWGMGAKRRSDFPKFVESLRRIAGLGVGFESTMLPVLVVVTAILVSYFLGRSAFFFFLLTYLLISSFFWKKGEIIKK